MAAHRSRSASAPPFATDERGATALELAFIAPLAILFMYAFVEFGRALFTQGVLGFAAEEATRYATVHYDATIEEIRGVAESKFIMIDPARISAFDVQSVLDPSDQTKLVTVQISYRFEPLVPVHFGPIMMTAASKGFLVEQP